MSEPRRKNIFLHIPKTAGTTMRPLFSRALGKKWHSCHACPDDSCYTKEKYLHLPTQQKWDSWLANCQSSSVQLIELHLDPKDGYRFMPDDFLGGARFKLYSKLNWMAILRDPLERLVSEYYYLFQPNAYNDYKPESRHLMKGFFLIQQ